MARVRLVGFRLGSGRMGRMGFAEYFVLESERDVNPPPSSLNPRPAEHL